MKKTKVDMLFEFHFVPRGGQTLFTPSVVHRLQASIRTS